jgi:N utilization substance protein B
MSVGTRREERERALSLLYEAEAKDLRAAALLAQLPVSPEPFVVDLVTGVDGNRDRIDELISRHAIDWTLERMPAVDRNILRLGSYELLERHDVPLGAVISEAVELAKRYSTDESGRFVNGMLASIAAETRPSTPSG